jgi:hypothetical protein
MHSFAVHTQNTIYLIDSASRCIAVIDRRTGRTIPWHAVVGCVLAGCRRETRQGFEFEKRARVGWQATFQRRHATPNGSLDLQLIVTSSVHAIIALESVTSS